MHCMNTTKNFVPLHNDSKHVKSLLHLVTSSLCCEISLNKNAFQYDAYHPLQWSSPLGVSAQGGVCPGGVCPGGVCPEGVCQTPPPPVNTIPDRCQNITLPQLRCGQKQIWISFPSDLTYWMWSMHEITDPSDYTGKVPAHPYTIHWVSSSFDLSTDM